ncbi:rCG61417 [Rattus norvegicus]|uniref:RCG61417 n=1 Tax=Rattus norvegicus TaxID=10116 RepID=A6HCD2_RAT|nr:rCG61417 [Rattus norvegicus]
MSNIDVGVCFYCCCVRACFLYAE